MEVDEESRGNVIVTHKVSHQHFDHVVVQNYHIYYYSKIYYCSKSDIDRKRSFG